MEKPILECLEIVSEVVVYSRSEANHGRNMPFALLP